MASTYTPTSESEKAVLAPEVRAPSRSFALADVILRFLLFASGLVAVVVMITSKQTELVPIPMPPFVRIPRSANFNHSPAFIYFVAALSVAGIYGLITTLISFFSLLKVARGSKLVFHFVIFDVLLLGIVAAATGSAGAVAYLGLKGNSHVQWRKICHVYGDFCKHIGSSVAVSLFGSIVLVLLILLSVYALSKRIPK
ncbi:hypothetical protein BUALT_Bualt14G0076600 [Buddleja alternifolia]|uniref:CASP-like protein n=1 Tax=Buddleja alternifolia TaxID=168488 RepID=A0AAV6WSX9_9LAMI|nr:hypothetical protein BUALT_Bualt14G0076600 [Buddleja alternifolia]